MVSIKRYKKQKIDKFNFQKQQFQRGTWIRFFLWPRKIHSQWMKLNWWLKQINICVNEAIFFTKLSSFRIDRIIRLISRDKLMDHAMWSFWISGINEQKKKNSSKIKLLICCFSARWHLLNDQRIYLFFSLFLS